MTTVRRLPGLCAVALATALTAGAPAGAQKPPMAGSDDYGACANGDAQACDRVAGEISARDARERAEASANLPQNVAGMIAEARSVSEAIDSLPNPNGLEGPEAISQGLTHTASQCERGRPGLWCEDLPGQIARGRELLRAYP